MQKNAAQISTLKFISFLQVKRCLVEVLSKAFSSPDSQLDQECKDILQAGL